MPDVRVQDEQGNIHIFPDGSTPEMISKAMGLNPPTPQPSAPPAQTDTGFLASLKRAGGGLLHLPGTVYDAFAKPPQNPDEERQQVVSGPVGLAMQRLIVNPMLAQHEQAKQLRAQAETQTPEQANNLYSGTRHMANMHDIASVIPILGPAAADITDRYLHGDKTGAVTDLALNAAIPKTVEGAGNLISKVGPAAAERLYQSALKPSTTLPFLKRQQIINTGLESKIPVSAAGAEKLGGLMDETNAQIAKTIKQGSASGATIDPTTVASRADQIKPKFANQVNPTSDLAAIEDSKQEFLKNNPNPISAEDAQAMKQGTYQQLKGRAYGELKSATVESQKALARGLKEELENQFPEIKGMNAQEAKYIGLDSALERALNRIGNHQMIGIGTPIVAGAAAGATHSGPIGMIAGTMKAVLDDPLVKSKLAIALHRTGKMPPWTAAGRIAQYSNLLGQQQPQPQEAQQ